MTENDFIQYLQEILDCEEKLSKETNLEALESWDSLAMLSVVTFFSHNLQIPLSFQEIKNVRTISDLMLLAQIKE